MLMKMETGVRNASFVNHKNQLNNNDNAFVFYFYLFQTFK